MSLYPLRRLLIPFILLAAAPALRVEISGLQADYQQLLEWLPYVTLGITILLCIYYNRSRLFTVTLVLLLVYYLIQFDLQTSLSGTRALFIYTTVSLAVPLLLLILMFLPERGLRNRYGVLVVSTIPLLLIVPVLIFRFFPEAVLQVQLNAWFGINPLKNYVLSVYASAGFAVAALTGLFMLCRQNSEYHAALVSVLVTGFITLGWFHLQKISVVMLSAAGIILIISLMRSSYDMAYRDELTGLLGRRALNERLKGLGRRYVIAMMDVDHFKQFNDTYGHDTGDEVLKMVARQIATVKGGGVAYRYGGEEFSVVFPGKEIDECKPHLELVRKAVEAYRMMLRNVKHRPKSGKEVKERRGRRSKNRGNETVSVTISIGVAEPGTRQSNVEDVLKAADTALYKAKKNGRNCLVAGKG